MFCLPQCDGSGMKSSFYSSVNGCTWFGAMMHIPGGQAVTLPDFFLIRTASLHMHTRRHNRGVCASAEQLTLPKHPCPQAFHTWATEMRMEGGEGSKRGGKGSVGLPWTVQTAVILLSPGLDNSLLHLALFWRNVKCFFTGDNSISSALRVQP